MKFKQRIIVLFFILICSITGAQDFVADDTTGCDTLIVKFTLDDSTGYSSIFWDFGNGDTSNSFDPAEVHYNSYGIYDVSIVLDGDTANPILKPDYIVVHETIEPTFDARRLGLLRFAFRPSDTIHFRDSSITYHYRYEYRDSDTTIKLDSNEYFVNYQNRRVAIDTFEFPDTGNYQIRFFIRSSPECADTLRRNFRVDYPPANEKHKPGNVFFPDRPGSPYYVIEPRDPAIILLFQVYTRAGVLAYQSEAPAIYWDGRTNNGRLLGAGVYYYILQATQGDPTGYFSTKGFIHLFRNEDNGNFSYF